MGETNMVYIYIKWNVIQLCKGIEFWHTIDEPWKHYAQWQALC